MAFGFGFSLTAIAKAVAFSVRSLFRNNEPGVWYDPSDMSTMFQDAAGTTPVTEVEQPVGKILDKSGRGNHATQSTTTSRPTLSARVNLLTKTEQFDDAAWSKTNATIAANAVVAPDGTTTADTFIPGAGTVFGLASGAYFNALSYFSQGVSVAAATYKYRLRVKDAGYDIAQLRVSEVPSLTGTNQASTRISLNTGVVIFQGSTGNLTNVTTACACTDDGWCDITLTFTSGAAQTLYFGIWAWNTTPITSDGVKGLHIWGADLRVANESASLPAYQRVETSTDYDTVGFPYYLSFDGVDDSLSTGSINFTGTDKMTVFAGSRYFGDSVGILCELSANASSVNGGFSAAVNDFSVGRESCAGRATATAGTAFTAPNNTTRITTRQIDFAQPTSSTEFLMRINGVIQTPVNATASEAGSGTFGNYPLYIGRRNGTTLPFNGHLYSLIVRGAQSTAQQIANAEKWVNSKTRAY